MSFNDLTANLLFVSVYMITYNHVKYIKIAIAFGLLK